MASLALFLLVSSLQDSPQESALLQNAIVIPPTGYVVKQGKAIHAMLDIAAPIDSSTDSSIPGIVIPQKAGGDAEEAQPMAAGGQTQSLADSSAYTATASAMQAAAQGGAAASEVRGARQQQLEEEEEDGNVGTMADEDEDMMTPTESESYAMEEPDGDLTPHKVVYNYNYGGAPQYATHPPVQEEQADPTEAPTSIVKPVPNFFVSPFQRWHDEDAAQHAYNLQQWRVKILQAKLKQAELNHQLTSLAKARLQRKAQRTGTDLWPAHSNLKSAPGASETARLRAETGKELKSIEKQMLTLAKVTERAVRARPVPQPNLKGSDSPRARTKFMSETKDEIQALRAKVAALQRQVKRQRTDKLNDAVASAALRGSVPSQVALWQRISRDVKA